MEPLCLLGLFFSLLYRQSLPRIVGDLCQELIQIGRRLEPEGTKFFLPARETAIVRGKLAAIVHSFKGMPQTTESSYQRSRHPNDTALASEMFKLVAVASRGLSADSALSLSPAAICRVPGAKQTAVGSGVQAYFWKWSKSSAFSWLQAR